MIKLDVVSGFLGAGKTTWINRYLKTLTVRGERVVLIENDFGKIGLDKAFITSEDVEIYEINQGCLCCSLKGNFLMSLKQIADEVGPDRVVIEPSGIVLLDEIYEFFTYPEIEDRYVLNSVTTVIDMRHYYDIKERYGHFFVNQIENAQRLLCSKTTQISEDALFAIVEELAMAYPGREILAKDWDSLSGDDIFHFLNDQPLSQRRDCRKPAVNQQKAGKSHGFTSYSLAPRRVFDRHALAAALAGLAEVAGEILRAKGFFRSEDGCWEVQYVNGDYEIRLRRGECREPAACFIGRSIEQTAIEKAFA